MITIGSVIEVTVVGIDFVDGTVQLVGDSPAGRYRLALIDSKAPSAAPKPLRLINAVPAAGADQAQDAPAGGPPAADLAPTNPGARRPAPRAVTPHSSPEEIANHFLANPEALDSFAPAMSLTRRRKTAARIAELVGPEIKTSEGWKRLVSITPSPDGTGWGVEGGLGNRMFGEKLHTRLEQEPRHRVAVQEALVGVKQVQQGAKLTTSQARSFFEAWKK
jgi:hypothetical protein